MNKCDINMTVLHFTFSENISNEKVHPHVQGLLFMVKIFYKK